MKRTLLAAFATLALVIVAPNRPDALQHPCADGVHYDAWCHNYAVNMCTPMHTGPSIYVDPYGTTKKWDYVGQDENWNWVLFGRRLNPADGSTLGYEQSYLGGPAYPFCEHPDPWGEDLTSRQDGTFIAKTTAFVVQPQAKDNSLEFRLIENYSIYIYGDYPVTLHPDGRVERPKGSVDKAAETFWDAVEKMGFKRKCVSVGAN